MLKLLKHDIKDTYLEIAVLNGLLIGFSVFALLAMKIQSEFLFIIVMCAWGITLAASFFMVLASVIKSFHSKLFSDSGYLTLTTPVSIDKILLSKIIVNMLWIAAVIVGIVVSVLILLSSITSGSALSFFFEIFAENPLEVFKLAVMGILGSLNMITMLIFVLVLANTGRMKKHKVLKGLLIYMGISFIVSLTNPFQTSIITLAASGKFANYFLGLAVSLVWSVLFYFASRYIITHKLELE